MARISDTEIYNVVKDLKALLQELKALLADIKANQTNGEQKTTVDT